MNRAEPLNPSFSALGSVDTAALIAAAADVALLIDHRGVIRDVRVGSQTLTTLDHADWIGRPFADTVTVESRPKVESLLEEAGETPSHAWRHVNHASPQGTDVPVMYSAIRAGAKGSVVAIGRDLRQLAQIQQRLVAAQQSMERDYLRLRQMESRYRALFQAVSEPVLIVDATTLKVVEANPAASRAFGEGPRRLAGRPIAECFAPDGRAALQAMIDAVRTARDPQEARLRLGADGPEVAVGASMFRQDGATLLLVRVSPPASEADDGAPMRRAVLSAVDRGPDAMAVTDASGRVLYANASFAELVQLDAPEQANGEMLDRWLGRSGTDLGVLIGTLRQNDSVRLFPSLMRGRFGAETTVEISAAAVPGDHPCLAFTIRDVGRRLPVEGRGRGLGRNVDQLTELVGRVPLKDIVGDTTDLIEQLCIEAALKLTRDNRAAAAEMLGLSRQSLYVKLHKYGLLARGE